MTQELAEHAEQELNSRGLKPGAEADRVDAEEWLAEQQRAIRIEDAHRPITELDLPVSGEELDERSLTVMEEPTELREPSPAHDIAPLEPRDLELAALVHTATEAQEQIADHESKKPRMTLRRIRGDRPGELGRALKPWPEKD